MIFAQYSKNKTYTHIDGYSKAKTIKGALNDLMREVAKYNKSEAELLVNSVKYNEVEWKTSEYKQEYFVECQVVPCATKYISDNQIEYKEANFYLHIMYIS